MKNKNVRDKQKITNILKYGVEHTFQSENNKEKSKLTMNRKYGCDYAQQNKNIKEKQLKSMIEKYGVTTMSQTKTGKEKNIISHRKTLFKKFAKNKFVIPMFSEQEYVENGDATEYNWKCCECNHIFKSSRNEVWFKEGAVKSYARCPNCFPKQACISASEKDVANFIRSITHCKVVENTRHLIDNYEIDIYVPDKNIAIEFDGLFYHSFESGIPINYHLAKTLLCQQKNIQLIHIFENEWKYKKDIIKSKLKEIFGIYDVYISIDQCKIKEIHKSETYVFWQENCIQHTPLAEINIGLFYDD